MQTYFIKANVEVVVEVFARNRQEALNEFELRMLDDVSKMEIFEDAWSMTDTVKVETADEHFER